MSYMSISINFEDEYGNKKNFGRKMKLRSNQHMYKDYISKEEHYYQILDLWRKNLEEQRLLDKINSPKSMMNILKKDTKFFEKDKNENLTSL